MNEFRLVLSSLFHYRWINLSVLAGVALTSAILSGALVVGDSVKESLRRNAAARISNIGPALVTGERFVSASLADRVAGKLGSGEIVAPILQVAGTASSRDSGQRVNRIQILGIDDRFWDLSVGGETPVGWEDERWMAVNEPLASRIGGGDGDTLIVRVEIPGALSKDAPLSGESEQTTPFTAKISTVLDSDHFGLYSLRAEQVPPSTIFVKLSRFQGILEQPDRVNVLAASNSVPVKKLQVAAQSSWDLDDLQLSVDEVGEGSTRQLVSSRVFFDAPIVDALKKVSEVSAPVLTYLATGIESNDSDTPYSMVAGTAPELNSIVDDSLSADEIILSDWLADDLGAEVGSDVTLVYNVVSSGRRLVQESRPFKVAKILPIGENGWNASWTPNFPGIFDVEDLDDWEPGIPIDRDRIRDKDDEFWDEFKATPKAFVNLDAAREMWANRFGNATAVRFRLADAATPLADQLRQNLKLEDIGMAYRDLPAEAESAVANSFDFGALFASMSFFLIAAALALAGLVFVFGIEQRSSQIGLLMAMGFTGKKVRRLFLTEALILSVIGSAIGLLGGYIYTKLALYGMSGVWQDAAAGIEFLYYLRTETLLISFFATVIIALLVVWFASRRISKIQPSLLISGSDESGGVASAGGKWDVIGFVGSLVAGLGCLFAPKVEGTMAEQGLFFGAGFLFVFAGIFLCSLLIRRFLRPSSVLQSIGALGRQHTVRRRSRSLAVIGLMAAGVFMVTAINSFRLDGERGAQRRGSGTGGFAFVGQSTLPVYEDLNSTEGREKYGLEELEPEFEVLSFRVSEGDDASCLNLNRAQSPRLMGVDVETISTLNPFTFTKTTQPSLVNDWTLLGESIEAAEEGVIVVPGVVDQNTAIYALQKGLGDRIIYESESGQNFAVEIVGLLDTSILQGSLLISEENFIKLLPDAGGYSFFLVDGDAEQLNPVATQMTRMFGDRGLEMRPAADRLNEFNAVQNTYLSIFSTLGGLGIFLGTIGLAIIVGRNVLERRGQLGVMQAMGFTRTMLARMVLSEHWFLHVSGVLLGLLAALVAVLPKLTQAASALPWGLLIGVNLAVLFGGLIFCSVAARIVLRGNLMESIRRE